MDMEVHRVYQGTPEKVVKKRLLEISAQEGKPIFRPVPVLHPEAVLEEGEIFITHKKLQTDHENLLELARAGCSEVVVVVEALLLLQEEYDEEFYSLSKMRQFATHVGFLLVGIEKEEKPSFSRFCYGLWKTMARKKENVTESSKVSPWGKRVSASRFEEEIINAATAGVALFKEVAQAVAENHKGIPALRTVCDFTQRNLLAWVELYHKKQEQHRKSHVFKFIGSDITTAQAALSVLEFVSTKEDYTRLSPLLIPAIELIQTAIAQHIKLLKIRELQIETESEMFAERLEVIEERLMQ